MEQDDARQEELMAKLVTHVLGGMKPAPPQAATDEIERLEK